ncbi:MAG TPA: hypothetical protein PK992_20765, partial [Planctomycetaceae bacterium]|nr:hypothetical protein [Planctomycetaceae bacterium]
GGEQQPKAHRAMLRPTVGGVNSQVGRIPPVAMLTQAKVLSTRRLRTGIGGRFARVGEVEALAKRRKARGG